MRFAIELIIQVKSSCLFTLSLCLAAVNKNTIVANAAGDECLPTSLISHAFVDINLFQEHARHSLTSPFPFANWTAGWAEQSFISVSEQPRPLGHSACIALWYIPHFLLHRKQATTLSSCFQLHFPNSALLNWKLLGLF